MPRILSSEKLARLFVLLILISLPVGFLSYRLKGQASDVIEVHARMAEAGGWSPAAISASVGEPLRLRLVSDDVLHSFAVGKSRFAIGQSDELPVDLEPGKVKEITLTFDRPGKYTFYCTRWCGLNHWRMRGSIEVTGQGDPSPAPEQPPYLQLGLDLDQPHPAEVLPESRPSAALGASLAEELPARYRSQVYLRSHSPAEIFLALQSDPAAAHLAEEQIWDLVAYLWAQNTSPEKLAEGAALYAQNCAACHGEAGKGDGVMAGALAGENGEMDSTLMEGIDGHSTVGPADFTDAQAMLGASPALLHGKIVRGGMGTGMPYWGPIFTDEQIWSIVDYLWSFQFTEME